MPSTLWKILQLIRFQFHLNQQPIAPNHHLLPQVCVCVLYLVHTQLIVSVSRHTIQYVSCGQGNNESQHARQTSVYFTGAKKTPFSRICSSILFHRFHCGNFFGLGHLQLQILAQSAQPLLRYVPLKLALVSSYFSSPYSFSLTLLNCYDSCMLHLISFKFGGLL